MYQQVRTAAPDHACSTTRTRVHVPAGTQLCMRSTLCAITGSRENYGRLIFAWLSRYFSVWEAEDPTPQGGSNNPKLQADWVNFLFTGADPAVLRSYHNATGISSLLAVRTAFFCGNKLCPDYKQKWATLLESTVKPMLADGSIFGVFFGDEICWSCTTWADVNTAGEYLQGTPILRARLLLQMFAHQHQCLQSALFDRTCHGARPSCTTTRLIL